MWQIQLPIQLCYAMWQIWAQVVRCWHVYVRPGRVDITYPKGSISQQYLHHTSGPIGRRNSRTGWTTPIRGALLGFALGHVACCASEIPRKFLWNDHLAGLQYQDQLMSRVRVWANFSGSIDTKVTTTVRSIRRGTRKAPAASIFIVSILLHPRSWPSRLCRAIFSSTTACFAFYSSTATR